MNKAFLKEILPPVITRYITGFFYGWHGNYRSWEDAAKRCPGYNSREIFERVRSSTLKVKSGEAKFERDSVTFDEPEYSFPVLSALLWIANLNNNKIRVLDFGGALGSIYFQNRVFLDSVSEVKWNVVEQKDFIEIGKNEFESEELRFYFSIEECLANTEIDVILLSGVLPYISDPYALMKSIILMKIRYILINRTPFIKTPDRLTLQKVKPQIYSACYPSWFFNYDKFLAFMSRDYDLIFSFDNDDRANIKSEFKGLFYRLKTPKSKINP